MFPRSSGNFPAERPLLGNLHGWYQAMPDWSRLARLSLARHGRNDMARKMLPCERDGFSLSVVLPHPWTVIRFAQQNPPPCLNCRRRRAWPRREQMRSMRSSTTRMGTISILSRRRNCFASATFECSHLFSCSSCWRKIVAVRNAYLRHY